MPITIPCRAKDPTTCKFHGPQLRAEAALNRGDLNTWLQESEAMLANANIAEVQEFANNHARPESVNVEPLTAQQAEELPIGSEATDSDGNPWRKTPTRGWQRINNDGTLHPEIRTNRYFIKENQPTLISLPDGASPTSIYQPGYPKKIAWQDLKQGDQISGGTVVGIQPTTDTKLVNVTITQPDGGTKTFTAAKHNKQTVIGRIEAATIKPSPTVPAPTQRGFQAADRTRADRIQASINNRDPYTVGGTLEATANSEFTTARIVYQRAANLLIEHARYRKADGFEGYVVAWDSFERDYRSLSDKITTELDLNDLATQAEIDETHRTVDQVHRTLSGHFQQAPDGERIAVLNRGLRSLDLAFWHKPNGPTDA